MREEQMTPAVTPGIAKAALLLETGRIDTAAFQQIVAADARFHIEEARLEADCAWAALAKLRAEAGDAAHAGVAHTSVDVGSVREDVSFDVSHAAADIDSFFATEARAHTDVDSVFDTRYDTFRPPPQRAAEPALVGPAPVGLGTIQIGDGEFDVDEDSDDESERASSVATAPPAVAAARGAGPIVLGDEPRDGAHRIGGVVKPKRRIGHVFGALLRTIVEKTRRPSANNLAALSLSPTAGDDTHRSGSSGGSSPPGTAATVEPHFAAPSVVRRKGRPMRPRMSEQPFSPSDFTRLRVLGQGAYGKVYLVKKSSFPDPGKTYAMKVMNKADLVKGALQDQAYVERDITRDARHAFVARLRHSFQTESRLYLLMDYYAGGPLHDALRRAAPKADGRCTVGQMRFYAAELVLGLEYLHGRGIVHRDIKPPNVLIDAQGHVAITDFGMAIRSRGEDDEDAAARRREGSPPRSTMFCGTDEYMAPEIFSRGKDYGFAVDWWALGVLCYDVVAGRSPFRPTRSDCDREQLTTAKGIRMKLWENILRKQPDYPADKFDDADAVSFLSALLTKDESSRPSTSERIRSMPFFRELDWARAEQCHLEPPFVPSVYCALIGFRKTTARSWGHVDAAGDFVCTRLDDALPKLDKDGESDVEDPKGRETPKLAAFPGYAWTRAD